MKKILIILTIISMIGACGKKDPILEERMDNGIIKIYDAANQEYFTGYVENTKINKNGIKYTAEKGNVKSGVKDGEYITYWDNGKVSRKEIYQRGELNGVSFKYNIYGDLLEQATYVNGKVEGSYIKVDGYKGIKAIGTLKNGVSVGKYEEYYLNGKLHKTLTLNEQGNIEGDYRMYTPEGNIWERAEYKDGLLHGFREEYHRLPEGMKLDIKGYYYNGKPDGNINRGDYYQKNPIISLDDYKKSIANSFTIDMILGDDLEYKKDLKIEYYLNGMTKSYSIGIFDCEYNENFDILGLLQYINEDKEKVKKVKKEYDLEFMTPVIQDTISVILGLLLSKNLTEQQEKDLATVIDAMKSLMVDVYVKERELAIEY